MNRIVLNQKYIAPRNSLVIEEADILEHVHNVLRPSIDDSLKLTFLNQGLSEGKITKLSDSKIEVEYLDLQRARPQRFHLIIGLSRPPTLQKILEHATTMGASEFSFFKAELSEKSYLQSKLFKDANYEKYLKLGLSQSGVYANLPKVNIYKGPFEINFSTLSGTKFLLDKNGDQLFKAFPLKEKFSYNLAIGPERGMTEDEIEFFNHQGFNSISLNSPILRVEWATISAMAQIYGIED
ncbi:MAG: 16S rRNA (uracil(1498)-N(3))-methyltransferase [Bacteriovoracaceae bacterium]